MPTLPLAKIAILVAGALDPVTKYIEPSMWAPIPDQLVDELT